MDGNYRITCHTVMEVLREHRDSVMAVLEAFVYDPLLNWRLMDSKDPRVRLHLQLEAVIRFPLMGLTKTGFLHFLKTKLVDNIKM